MVGEEGISILLAMGILFEIWATFLGGVLSTHSHNHHGMNVDLESIWASCQLCVSSEALSLLCRKGEMYHITTYNYFGDCHVFP